MDGELLRIGTPQALALRGKIGIAIARRIYRRFCGIFHSARFAGLRLRRVQPQRMLWTSPTAEDHADSDFHYVEELIGPDTITAVSPATLDAFREHGQVRGITLHRNLAEADAVIENLQSVGIDFDSVAQRLQADGVSAFAASLGSLLTMLDGRRGATAKS